MNTSIFAIVVAATLIATNLVAFLWRGSRDFQTYSADANHHGPFRITLSLTGTIVGGGMFLAVGQIGYEAGIIGYVIGVIYIIGLGLVGALIPTLRRTLDEYDSKTLIDLLGKVYSRRVAVMFTFVTGMMYFFLLGGQFVALYEFARFAEPLASSSKVPWLLVALGAVSILLYPAFGGLRKDIITDMFQVGLIVLCAAVLGAWLIGSYNFSTMWSSLPAEHVSGTGYPEKGYGLLFLVGAVLFLPLSFFVRQDVWQRVRAAKNSRYLGFSFVAAGVIAAVFYIFFTTVGMLAYSQNIGTAQTASLATIVAVISDEWVLGFVVGAFFAAVLSSADTFINNISIAAVSLIRPAAWLSRDHDASPKDNDLLKWATSLAVASGLIGALFAWYLQDIVDLMVGAFSLLLIFLPMIIGTFVESWRTEFGAYWGSLVSTLVFVTLIWVLDWDPGLAFAPAVLLSALLYFIGFQLRPSARSADR